MTTFNGLLYVPKVVEESQQAAEALVKTVIAGPSRDQSRRHAGRTHRFQAFRTPRLTSPGTGPPVWAAVIDQTTNRLFDG